MFTANQDREINKCHLRELRLSFFLTALTQDIIRLKQCHFILVKSI